MDHVHMQSSGGESDYSWGSNATAGSQAAPLDFADAVQIYQCVADRRSSFDVLLWSVPATGFGAQAFLFTSALAGDSARSSRLIAMGLSILLSVMTLQLFTRQLQAEDADRRWLDDWEKRHMLAEADRSHGATWSQYQSVLPDPARHFGFMTRAHAYTCKMIPYFTPRQARLPCNFREVWAWGCVAITVAALAVLLLAAFEKGEPYLELCGNGGRRGTGGSDIALGQNTSYYLEAR